MNLLASFGKRMRTLRTERGWSQEEFAYQCGLHRTYIGHVELGKKNISFNNLVTVASTLGLTLSELFSGLEDGDTPNEQPQDSTRRRPSEATATLTGKVPADVNRLLTELRVQRLTMERALATLHQLIVDPSVHPSIKPSRERSTKKH